MWTPKRILMLAGGFLSFALIYILYSLTSLGRINTLPPLPDQYQYSASGKPTRRVETWATQPTPLERKLEMAFPRAREEEWKWPVQIELPAKSMVMAAGRFEIVEDGRVLLEPMSLAVFGKNKNDGRDIEINTLKCKQAYLRLDRPISQFSPGEMSGRKVIEAELIGDNQTKIFLTNNRRTALKEDDLLVTIPTGPVYYVEKTQTIRTSDHIYISDGEKHMVGGRLVPPKAVIDAQGMEMELATTSPPPRPGIFPSAKPKNDSISGVKRIILKEDVVMNLFVAGGGPLPGNNKTPAKETVATRDAKFSKVRITTPGRFEYELFKDHDMARFDVPGDAQQANSPQDVTVERFNEDAGNDMLVCKHLELRLKRRNNDDRRDAGPTVRQDRRDAGATPATDRRDAGPTSNGSTEQGVEIETAHATGPFVTLTSDAEKLDAHGNDFFHDAAKKLTILKGTPYMEANKEDSLIQAPEMRIQEIALPAAASPSGALVDKGANPPAKSYQQVQAAGPGSIHMINKNTGTRTVHAFWNDKLVSTRDGGLDLLVLQGSARFVDEEHEQSLKAETLKVWLLADEKKPQTQAKTAPPAQAVAAAGNGAKGEQAATKGSATPAQTRRPQRVEALRNVLAHSAELNIHDAARLVVHFLDVPLDRMPPPSSNNAKPGASPLNSKPAAAASSPLAARPPAAAPSGAALADSRKPKPDAQPKAPEKYPIDLSARSIEAKVLRCEERMALDHLWAEGGALDNVDKRGGVIVRQKKDGEEGVYIEGNTLDMNSTADGNKLHVTGDLARLKMDKIFILGPEVSIDQVANKAWVDGEGAMQLQSDKTLDGKALKQPVPLTIHWSQSMVFFGAFAEFYGSIQAEQREVHEDEQKEARLACQHLQVRFDRPISLKEGMRGDQAAKVSMLVADKGAADQDVRVEDQTFANNVLDKYQLLMGREIHMNTIPRDDDAPRQPGKSGDANEVRLFGPGSVRLLQRGDADLTVMPGAPAPARPAAGAKPQQQEKKLTYIRFEKQMRASSQTNVASFWGAVRVLTLPCEDPHVEIDLDGILTAELPVGAMYLRCNVLKVGTYQRTIYDDRGKKLVRTYQEMDARAQVYVQGKEFTAQCDHMTFNEEKDQVIFIGESDNLAVLSRSLVKGDKPDTIRARKIIYYRTTGRVDVSEFKSLDG